MRTPVDSGFTLIEVILFLAISGLFFLIAFMGLSGRSQMVQFTDSVRSLEAFMQAQVSEVRNGVNLTGDGDNDNQVVLGSILHFTPGSSQVRVFKIRGARLANSSAGARDQIYQSVNSLAGQSIVYEQGQYNIDWQVVFRDPSSNGSTAQTVGFIRNPNGTDILAVIIDRPSGTDPLALLNAPATYRPTGSGYIMPPEGHFCLEGTNGQVADIRVGESSRQLDIEPIFDPESGACSTI